MRRSYVLLALLIAVSLALTGCGAIAGLVGGAPQSVVTIANKITSLPAGQTYTFNVNFQHTQGAGVTVKLTGQGTLLQNGSSAFYIAPPSPPTPNTVTVTATAANGSNVSDSDTFTITPAAGPVVSISPGTFSATGGGAPVTLNVSVTQDNPSDVLAGGTGNSSPDCNNGPCGVLGPFIGTPGGGSYTVQFFPARSVTTSTLQGVQVVSNLPQSTPGFAYVNLNAGTAACALSGSQVAFLLTGTDTLGPTALAGSITVASDGSLTGEYDLVDPAGDANKAITSGKCVAGTVNNTGSLTLTDSSATHTFNFSMRGNLGQAPRDRRQQVGDGRAGAEADAHPVLDEVGGGLGGELLLGLNVHACPGTVRRVTWGDWVRGAELEPSIYAADFTRLGAQLETLLDAGVRIFHFDVGDGHFVSEITIGPVVLKSISGLVHDRGGRLDCHLMVSDPQSQFESIKAAGGDSVTFHVEAAGDPAHAIAHARELGLGAGVSFNPET
ncbi:MAG TPA: hypothetical protein VJV74_11750, partial [Terriglobia bacterium]|nr:hypothetical protein [Terriglobia bacterium]